MSTEYPAHPVGWRDSARGHLILRGGRLVSTDEFGGHILYLLGAGPGFRLRSIRPSMLST
jgi:hypothetical protein